MLRIVTKLKIRNLRLKHIAVREQAPGMGQTGTFASSLSFGNLAVLMGLRGKRKVRVEEEGLPGIKILQTFRSRPLSITLSLFREAKG